MQRVGKHGHIYVIKSGDFYKIGMTMVDIVGRIKSHKSSNPNMIVVGIFEVNKVFYVEQSIHKLFKDKRKGRTEWFNLSEDEVSIVIDVLKWQQRKFYD